MAWSGTTLSSSSWLRSGPLTSNTYLLDFLATASPRRRAELPSTPLTLDPTFYSPHSCLTSVHRSHLPEPAELREQAAISSIKFHYNHSHLITVKRGGRGGGDGWCWGATPLLVTLMPLFVRLCVQWVCMHTWMYSIYVCVCVCASVYKGITAQVY